MIQKLEQLTLSQFVDLVTGDTKILCRKGEIPNPAKLAVVVRDIVMEYRAIADPGGVETYLTHIEEWIKAKINVIVLTMCRNLAELKQYDRAREVLDSLGVPCASWNERRMDGEITARLGKARRALDDLEAESEKMAGERENIRAMFDTQTAELMAHFKFQIDPGTIKATLYANLVARHNREIKAQLAAMRKK